MDSQSLQTERDTGHRHRAVRPHIAVLPWILAAALFVTNVGTLLSNRVQSAGHDRLVSLITAVFGDSVSSISGHRGHVEPTTAAKSAEDLAKQNLALAERRKELEFTLARLQRQNSEIKAQKVEADNRFQKLQDEHTGLRNKHIALEKEQSALKEISVRRANAVKTLADRISRKLALHAGELIAELPLRAAPYVGVFTLVTGTALDIRSDCELARTLNGLVLEYQEAPVDTHAVCQYTDRIPDATQVWNEAKRRAGSFAVPVYQRVERLYQR